MVWSFALARSLTIFFRIKIWNIHVFPPLLLANIFSDWSSVRAVTQAFVFRFRARTVGQRSADCCYLSHTATFCYFFDPNELFGGETAVEARRRRVKRFRSENQLQNTKIKCVTISSIYLSIYLTQFWAASLGDTGALCTPGSLGRAPPAAGRCLLLRCLRITCRLCHWKSWVDHTSFQSSTRLILSVAELSDAFSASWLNESRVHIVVSFAISVSWSSPHHAVQSKK